VSRIDAGANTIRRITTAEGLAADFVHDAFSASDGTIWFGTENGVSKLTPAPPPVERSRTIYISDLSVAGIEYAISPFGQRDVTGIEVPSSENNIQVNFVSVGAPDQGGFIYRLEGSSNDTWSAPVAARTLNFANLSPGEYKLHISPAVVGANGTTESTVSFAIKPPFYRSWWFLLLAFLVAVGSIATLDRYRAGKTRQVEKALVLSRESETRFRTLAETASDAILTIDEESTIVFANESVEKIFGHTPDEVIGKRLTMLMPERMRGSHEHGLARYLGSGSKKISWDGVELPGLHKSGNEIPLEVSFGEFERDGNRYFTGIARDISERKRAEAELQRSREERVAELQRIRSRIATDLHDDIGSSLTQISVYSELARQQGKDNGKTLGPLAMITNISNELVDTMSDIVWAINPRKDHLADLTQRMRRYAANALSASDIEMTFIAPDSGNKLPLGANIRREVFLIFKETINNIVKHSHAKNTEISLEIREHSMAIRFVDDGVGFDEAEARNEREPDWKRFRGGNGLTNMRRRAEDLGGRYEIDSTVGAGTRVTLKIPFDSGETPA
jgi:PAS domain S-box-containing protein